MLHAGWEGKAAEAEAEPHLDSVHALEADARRGELALGALVARLVLRQVDHDRLRQLPRRRHGRERRAEEHSHFRPDEVSGGRFSSQPNRLRVPNGAG